MILETAVLDVKPDQDGAFEEAFREAEEILSSMPGYVWHALHRCVEKENRYLLLVRWQTLEDHTRGFRGSPEYERWKELLHHFYEPFPEVEHYRSVTKPSDS